MNDDPSSPVPVMCSAIALCAFAAVPIIVVDAGPVIGPGFGLTQLHVPIRKS